MEYHIIGGIAVKAPDVFSGMDNYPWERKSLGSIPSTFLYKNVEDVENSVQWYGGVGNFVVFTVLYGYFGSRDSMFDDLKNKGDVYNACVRRVLTSAENQLDIDIREIDWSLPLCLDDVFEVEHHHIRLRENISNAGLDFRAVVDCAMALQFGRSCDSYIKISSLVSSDEAGVNLKTMLRELYRLSDPALFCINVKEDMVYRDFYEKWRLTEFLSLMRTLVALELAED